MPISNSEGIREQASEEARNLKIRAAVASDVKEGRFPTAGDTCSVSVALRLRNTLL